jgi:hypothetical protein
MKVSTWVVVSALALGVAAQTPDAVSAPASPPYVSGDLVVQARVKRGGVCGKVCENRCSGKGSKCIFMCTDKCRSKRR